MKTGRPRGLIHGVGINDASYVTNGKTVCPFYSKWRDMLGRCYSKTTYRTYEGCTVCDDWRLFSKFKAWMEAQDWEGKELDKDLLIQGNKVYSPDTCVFVSKEVNTFTTKCQASRGEYPIGVCLHKESGKFVAQCRVDGKKKHLGIFTTVEQAHNAWVNKKRELAIELASRQEDCKISSAILNIKYEEWL